MEHISVLNDLYWKVGEPLPQMFVDGNIIPLSQHIIEVFNRPIDHSTPLVLYFPGSFNNYDVREYNRKLTGLEILGAIKTYWNEKIQLTDKQLYDVLEQININNTNNNDLKNKIIRILRGSNDIIYRYELPRRNIFYDGIHPYGNNYIVQYGR